jgi:hypothetical protein
LPNFLFFPVTHFDGNQFYKRHLHHCQSGKNIFLCQHQSSHSFWAGQASDYFADAIGNRHPSKQSPSLTNRGLRPLIASGFLGRNLLPFSAVRGFIATLAITPYLKNHQFQPSLTDHTILRGVTARLVSQSHPWQCSLRLKTSKFNTPF